MRCIRQSSSRGDGHNFNISPSYKGKNGEASFGTKSFENARYRRPGTYIKKSGSVLWTVLQNPGTLLYVIGDMNFTMLILLINGYNSVIGVLVMVYYLEAFFKSFRKDWPPMVYPTAGWTVPPVLHQFREIQESSNNFKRFALKSTPTVLDHSGMPYCWQREVMKWFSTMQWTPMGVCWL